VQVSARLNMILPRVRTGQRAIAGTRTPWSKKALMSEITSPNRDRFSQWNRVRGCRPAMMFNFSAVRGYACVNWVWVHPAGYRARGEHGVINI